MREKFSNRNGQIWIETVIYTLVGLALIALVLSIIMPRINEFRDGAIIEQTIDALNVFDNKIEEVLSAPGNIRIIEFSLRRGNLNFDPVNDKIYYRMDDSRILFSQPGVEIIIGRLNVTTTKGSKKHSILLSLSLGQNITFDGQESEEKRFNSASTPYKFSIENKGFINENIWIDIKEIS